MPDTSVGGCSSVTREITTQPIENPKYSHHFPGDEWFRGILSRTDEGKALETFNQAIRAQLDERYLLGRLPEILDVATDMHLIPRHSKKLGSDLRGGGARAAPTDSRHASRCSASTPNRGSALRLYTWTKPHPCMNPCVKSSIRA